MEEPEEPEELDDAATDVDVLVETREARYARSRAAPNLFSISTTCIK